MRASAGTCCFHTWGGKSRLASESEARRWDKWVPACSPDTKWRDVKGWECGRGEGGGMRDGEASGC